ncbi:hypothetical protein RJ640_005250 [Escallonia rubra]|uniref:Uncharacterized protein n=1 Tax=Escallonia rubra TaxID=112253 RepID=A0AA88QJN2_9ASTE|nr:hypothetical protein RJ640_005250 [Escallonia rubra]
MATEQPKAATEETKIDLFEDDDEFEEFEIDQVRDNDWLSAELLDGNYISGSMPLDIGNLVNLEFLSLCNNMFGGNIPESIGNLFKLTELYVYENYISGKLPSSIGNISELSVLALEANMLEDLRPTTFTRPDLHRPPPHPPFISH